MVSAAEFVPFVVVNALGNTSVYKTKCVPGQSCSPV